MSVCKKEMAIVFGITGNWAFALGNTLIGLKKHNPDIKADIIVYYDNLSIKNRFALKKIYPVKFLKYRFPFDSSKINNLNIFTEMSFSRYECFKLLNKYRQVLYLDVDILIQKAISGLFKLGRPIGLLYPDKTTLKQSAKEEINNYDLNKPSYGTGTILFNDSSNRDFTNWCYKKTVELAEFLVFPDQAIINFLLQEFNLPFDIIGEEYVYNPQGEDPDKAIMLHAYGEKKFWNGLYSSEWNDNNQIWIQLGGLPYDKNWDYLNRPSFKRQPSKWFKDFIKRHIG